MGLLSEVWVAHQVTKRPALQSSQGLQYLPQPRLRTGTGVQECTWFCHIVDRKVMTIQIVVLFYLLCQQKEQQKKVCCRNFPRETAEDLAEIPRIRFFCDGESCSSWSFVCLPFVSLFCFTSVLKWAELCSNSDRPTRVLTYLWLFHITVWLFFFFAFLCK